MSESLLASLPRFDTEAPTMPEMSDFASSLQPEGMEVLPELPEESVDLPPMPDPGAAQAELMASLETALKELPGAVAQMDAEVRRKATETVTALAADLFPKLSEKFLAEEISRHLPGLLAPAVQEVEVLISPDVAGLFSEAIDTQADNHVRYSVRGDDRMESGQVRISWTSGGFDYDFEELFTACMQRLNPDSQSIEE